jgi:hypothetical protein
MHHILTYQGSDEEFAEFEAMDLPWTAPSPPASLRWPPDRATREWINVVLDIEMLRTAHLVLDTPWSRILDRKTVPKTLPAGVAGDPGVGELRELLAIANAERGDDSLLLDLLPDPAHPLSMTAREFIAGRLKGREAHRPRKTELQRQADNLTWRAVEDSRRIEALLRARYPQRPAIVKVSIGIAADRWGLLHETVANARDR